LNLQKSNINPWQVIHYLGSMFHTWLGIVFPSEDIRLLCW
jgi:hypothetical protein